VRFRFGDRCVDSDRMEILGPDGPIHVEPQVFEVVALLVANRDRVVTKAELLDAVWGSRFVSESTLTSRIKSARRATGDDGTAQAVIRTVHGRGYQWVAEVSVESGEPRPGVESGEPQPAAARVRMPVAPPVLLDSFFGRLQELADVRKLLDRARVVTIVGPGGVGKTRLALEVVSGRTEPAEIAVVELATVGDPEAVGEAVAAALGVQTGQRADAASACAEYLADSPALLVVDNCEHVRPRIAAFLAELAARCPGLRLLCTSRVPLGVPGEQVFGLHPLPLPGPDAPIEAVRASPAVELFIARATRAAADLPLNGDTLGRIESLCRALDGLPLAIEFAASRSAALGLAGVADRLDRRLDLLGADHAGPARHASLRATIDWSYELLDAHAQALFRALCVFPAGVRLASAEQIAATIGSSGDAAAIVARLVQASILTRSERPSGARFVPLETVRAFGLDQLHARGELAAAQEAMAGWALRFVADVDAGVHTADEPFWDDLVHHELPNLRAVRRYLADHRRLAELVALLRGLTNWAAYRDASEIWRWQLDLLDQARSAPAEIRLPALVMVAAASWRDGQLDLARQLAQEAHDQAPTGWVGAQALDTLATVALFAGRFEEATRLWLERAAIESSPGYRPRSDALAALSLGYAGDLERARRLAADATAEAERLGSPTAMAWAYYVRGEVEHATRSGQADAWLESAVRTAGDAGVSFIAGVAMVTLASRRAHAGDVATAADLYRRLIAQWLRTGAWTQLWTTLRNAADLLLGHDDETAVRIWAAAHADPQAAALGGDAAVRETRHRAEVVERLGHAPVRDLEAQAAGTPRAWIAEDAARALSRAERGVRPRVAPGGGRPPAAAR
jgi:predicted ATPase/DNA-binding winged helix-turn-helix (wHTH) protein